MSHELRTPLNSLLILSKLLAENPEGNLSREAGRVRARRSTRPGSDLLDADQRHPRPVEDRVGHDGRRRSSRVLFAELRDYVERTFRQVANDKGLEFDDRRSTPELPPAIETDPKRLQQVLKNLLSNAFKFTEQGVGRRCTIETADERLERATSARSNAAPSGRRVPRDRHRHRHPGREAADHLRGVPAGRRHDQPQVRRHRPRPVDQPRDRAAARRRDPADQRGRRRAARSRSTCRSVYTPTERRVRRRRASSAPSVAARGRRRAGARTRSTSR